MGKTFTAREGVWVGAKVGVFSMTANEAVQLGYTDIDWFRIDRLKQ